MITRNHRILFQGFAVALEEMEVKSGSKEWRTCQFVRHPGGVGVLPLHADGTVYLIRQLRTTVEAHLLELPAGRLKPGEDPAECGLRELVEETGIIAGKLEPLGITHPSPDVRNEVIHLFLATGLSQGEATPEQYEDIEVVKIPLRDAVEMALNGSISDAKTAIALFRTVWR